MRPLLSVWIVIGMGKISRVIAVPIPLSRVSKSVPDIRL